MEKPTGKLGPFIVRSNLDGTVTGSFVPITLPKSKAEAEQCIVHRFLASMNQHLVPKEERFFLSDPISNDENDFDFTVQTPKGKAFLELMEIAPLQGPYNEATSQHNIYDFAQVIFQGILRKSQRYPKQMTNDLFLLIYVTHWTFTMCDVVIACVRFWCAREPLAFSAVFSFQSFNELDGTPRWIFPVPPDLIGDFDPEKARDSTLINLDPSNWNVWQ